MDTPHGYKLEPPPCRFPACTRATFDTAAHPAWHQKPPAKELRRGLCVLLHGQRISVVSAFPWPAHFRGQRIAVGRRDTVGSDAVRAHRKSRQQCRVSSALRSPDFGSDEGSRLAKDTVHYPVDISKTSPSGWVCLGAAAGPALLLTDNPLKDRRPAVSDGIRLDVGRRVAKAIADTFGVQTTPSPWPCGTSSNRAQRVYQAGSIPPPSRSTASPPASPTTGS